MEVVKIKNDKFDLYNFCIKKGEKVLEIVYGGNFDLYWTLVNLNHNDNVDKIQNETVTETFIITKDNYFIYELFEELMVDVKEARIYKPNSKTLDGIYEYITDPFDLEERHESEEEECARLNVPYKNSWRHNLIYNNGTITWHSDDDEYNVSNYVKITKIKDAYKLEFTRPPIQPGKYAFGQRLGRIGIRFRNSGSTYDPFNLIFMRMYNKLQEYNPEYHQIHMEELEYHKTRTRKKQYRKGDII